MKLPCRIIEDLMPLYEDSLCCEESRRAVEAHLSECMTCRDKYHRVNSAVTIPYRTSREDAAMAKGLKKIRRRWVLSLVALVLVIPVIMMIWNGIRGEGVCIQNLDEMAAVRAYAAALEDGRFADAANALDHGIRHAQIRSTVASLPDGYDFSQFEEMSLGRETWMIQTVYRELYEADRLSATEFWKRLVLEQDCSVFVPEAVWYDLRFALPEAIQEIGDNRWLVDNVSQWLLQQTPWGSFCIRENAVFDADCTAAELCCGLVLVPMEIYREAVPQLEAMAQESRQHTLERFGDAAAMTKTEFHAAAAAHYASKLLELQTAGHALRSTGLERCRRSDDGVWHVQWGMEVLLDGSWYPMSLNCLVKDSGITLSSIGWPVETPEHSAVVRTLFPDYPPDLR